MLSTQSHIAQPSTPSPTATPVETVTASTTAETVGEGHAATDTSAWTDSPEKREALIRLAAYSFYERRGYISGHELEDWLQAELEVDRQRVDAAKPAESNG